MSEKLKPDLHAFLICLDIGEETRTGRYLLASVVWHLEANKFELKVPKVYVYAAIWSCPLMCMIALMTQTPRRYIAGQS